MTFLQTSDVDAYLDHNTFTATFFLLFGNDAGLVQERAQKLISHYVHNGSDPFQFMRFEGDTLAKDPNRLWEEMQTLSLFGSTRVLEIEIGNRPIAPLLEKVLDLAHPTCKVILIAKALRRDAPLRRLLENHSRAMVLECEPDTPKMRARLIEDMIHAAHMRITPEAQDMLVSLLGADRLTTRNEVEKLLLYAHGKEEITVEDVKAILSEASLLVSDQIIHAAFSADMSHLEEMCQKEFAAGMDPAYLLGQGLRYAFLLHQIRSDVETLRQSISLDTAVRSIRLPFPLRKTIEHHARQWKGEQLLRAISRLSKAIFRTRLENALAKEIAIRTLLSLRA